MVKTKLTPEQREIAAKLATTEEELYELATTEYNFDFQDVRKNYSDRLELFKIILNNDKCNEATLKAIIDVHYLNDNDRCRIYTKIIEHPNATEEIHTYIMELVNDSRNLMESLCKLIAKNARSEKTLKMILNCKHAEEDIFLSYVMLEILGNEHVTEGIILDMLVTLIVHDEALYCNYPEFLSEVVRKSQQKKNLEIAVVLAMTSNISENLKVFNTLFESNKIISKKLFDKCMNAVLKEAEELVNEIEREKDFEKKKSSIEKARESNEVECLIAFANCKYDIEWEDIERLISISKAINIPKLATIVAERKDCYEDHLRMLVDFIDDEQCMLAVLKNENRTTYILSEIASLGCGKVVCNLIADEKVTAEILDKIASYDFWVDEIYYKILGNPKRGIQTEWKLIERGDDCLNCQLASMTEHSVILKNLSESKNFEVQLAVFKNPKTPWHIANSLKRKWEEEGNILASIMFANG